jgi:hypothetical protein
MKIYLMYIKYKGLEPSLYAYTNNNEYYKRFKKERNKDIFVIKEKDVNKDEFYDFAKKHKNLNLKECLFETYTDTGEEYKRSIVSLICTYNEESSVVLNYEYINSEIAKSTSEIGLSFNKEIIDALNTIYYFDFLKNKINDRLEMNEYNIGFISSDSLAYSKVNSDIDKDMYSMSFLDGIPDGKEKGYNYDYLAIFIRMYGYTMSSSAY